jgi:hypothetical protein
MFRPRLVEQPGPISCTLYSPHRSANEQRRTTQARSHIQRTSAREDWGEPLPRPSSLSATILSATHDTTHFCQDKQTRCSGPRRDGTPHAQTVKACRDQTGAVPGECLA